MRETTMAASGTGIEDTKWQAIIDRRKVAEAFLYGVTTTRIFCLPSCKSRLPRRENVRVFESAKEAIQAGYRPCKRCQPAGPDPEQDLNEKIIRACGLLANQELTISDVARAVALSRFHFQRLFKAFVGISPKVFATARRLDLLKHSIRRNRDITTAVYEAGFKSSSRAYSDICRKLGMTPSRLRKGGAGEEIAYATGECALGCIVIAATSRGICAVELGERAEDLVLNVQKSFPRAILKHQSKHLKKHLASIVEGLKLPRQAFDLPLDIRGTVFQHQVWKALQGIPVGQTRSYQQLAKQLKRPQAIRAVASACAANKLALLIPCHRAVRSDSGLGGYRWGLERKQKVLEFEHGRSQDIPDQPR